MSHKLHAAVDCRIDQRIVSFQTLIHLKGVIKHKKDKNVSERVSYTERCKMALAAENHSLHLTLRYNPNDQAKLKSGMSIIYD